MGVACCLHRFFLGLIGKRAASLNCQSLVECVLCSGVNHKMPMLSARCGVGIDLTSHIVKILTGAAAISAFGMSLSAAAQSPVPNLPELVPANPEAGECYARVEVPTQTRTSHQTVIVEDGYRTVDVTPEQLRTRTENIMVKEPSVEYRVRQPRYQTVSEQVLVRPAYDRLAVTPPQFDIVTETLLMSSPSLIWKKGNPGKLRAQGYKIHATADAGAGGQGYRSTVNYGQTHRPSGQDMIGCGPTCEIWCLVEEPGVRASFNRKVLKSPAQVRREPVPAKYETVMKQVVVDPGGVEEIPIPAEYRTMMIEDVIPGIEHSPVQVPPKYADVTAQVPVSAARYEWRRVVCQPGTHPQDRQASTTHYSSSSARTGSYTSSTTTSGAYVTPPASTVYGSSQTSGYIAPSAAKREKLRYNR